MGTYLDVSAAGLRQWEGDVAWMYRDSSPSGYITTAIGELIPNCTAAQAMPFLSSTNAPATPVQIRAEWTRVMDLPRGHLAAFYRYPGSLLLSTAYRDARLAFRQAGFVSQLRLLFPGVFDAFPDPAKVALVDMAFNLGMGGLEKYLHLVSDCRQRQFADAAENCYRGGIGPDRNAYTKSLFEQAAKGVTP